ncbi:MAG: TRAP transporter large permease [Spirochaetia bacterium]|nr:TRAP transporter large permease [Spirochaetia bacterium]
MIALFLLFFILIAIGFPVAISIGLSSIISLIAYGYPLIVIAQKMVTGIDSFTFIAIPLFILAGELMNVGKITDKIFDFAKANVGSIPGGLAHANVVASVIFAGMSGSAIADAGGLGTVEMKAMKDAGFDDEFSSAVTAASSTIGPIFPPSIPFVIYGGIASVSIGKLFLGGILPGLAMMLALMILIFFYALKHDYPRTRFSFKELARQSIRSFIPMMTPVIILSGFVTGLFTPTEASAVAVFYALIVGGILYREISFKKLVDSLRNTAVTSANVIFIIGTATLFSFILTNEGFTQKIADTLFMISDNPTVILLIINLVLFILGMIMEPGAILIMLLPILLPIVEQLSFDYVHFGVMIILNLMIGQVTPPFGMCLFTISQVGHVPINRLSRAVIPFIFPLVVVLLLTILFPGIITWLPNLLMP